jgi:integrase
MTTIRKRGGRYHVQIRKAGQPSLTKSFVKKSDAQTWAKSIESKIERGVFHATSEAEQTTLTSLNERYERDILPTKRSRQAVLSHLRQVQAGLGGISLARLHPADLASYRDQRLKQVGSQSVLHELRLVQRILNTATTEWGIYLPHGNPVSQVRMPKRPKGRERRISPEEETSLVEALAYNPVMRRLVTFAIETGMRRGELANMRWDHINWKAQTLQIPETKTDIPRTIPLSKTALEALSEIPRRLDGIVWGSRPGQHHSSLREGL